MAEFYDISTWEEHPYLNTGGTRDKAILESPKDSSLYYFKTSLKKEAKDYKYEFWSEIIASEIGTYFGFNVLKYDVAWNKDRIGCLSKSMVTLRGSQLFEGYKWLTAFEPSYDLENKEAYTFQIIERMFNAKFNGTDFVNRLISTIIFDCIIGNEDRHQENWGIIMRQDTIDRTKGFRKKEIITRIVAQYSPIYDSGSSLGRELLDDKVSRMLQNQQELDAYINRGKSEIHWEGERGKQRHFDLIAKIAGTGHRSFVVSEIARIRQKFKEENIASIINNIDNCLPPEFDNQKIPEQRKELLIKLVNLRIKKLIALQI